MRPFLIAKMTLKMMLREPLVLIWNLGFPILVFHVSKYMQRDSFDKIYVQFFNTMLAYTIVMNCIYGIGLCLVGWREDGLLRTFVHGARAQINLVVGLILGISVLNVIFASLMFLFCNMQATGFSFPIILKNLSSTLLVSVVFGTGAVLLNKVPLRWKTLSTVVSIFGWLMMVESSFTNSFHAVQSDNPFLIASVLNPIRFVRVFFAPGGFSSSGSAFVIAVSLVLLASGWWATLRLSGRSCERR